MFHRSERLFLRPVVTEDWRAIHRALSDECVAAMLACVPWPYREQDAIEFATRVADPKFPTFAITVPGEPEAPLVGVAWLREDDGEAAIGLWLARDQWDRGYATETVRALCEVARAIGHKRLHAGHFLDNPRSARVLRKTGFAETGEIRPMECRGRGGELLLARRYVQELAGAELAEEPGPGRVRAA